ncbi:MAG: hypothetical protein QXO40_00300 [Candidatus Aenigmatarchaeota archaeon]
MIAPLIAVLGVGTLLGIILKKLTINQAYIYSDDYYDALLEANKLLEDEDMFDTFCAKLVLSLETAINTKEPNLPISFGKEIEKFRRLLNDFNKKYDEWGDVIWDFNYEEFGYIKWRWYLGNMAIPFLVERQRARFKLNKEEARANPEAFKEFVNGTIYRFSMWEELDKFYIKVIDELKNTYNKFSYYNIKKALEIAEKYLAKLRNYLSKPKASIPQEIGGNQSALDKYLKDKISDFKKNILDETTKPFVYVLLGLGILLAGLYFLTKKYEK